MPINWNKNMTVVYALNRLKVEKPLLKISFDAMIRSIVTYCLSVFVKNMSMKHYNKIQTIYRKAKRIQAANSDNNINNDCNTCVRRLFNKILNDKCHPLNSTIHLLPHGRVSMLYCRTNRFLKSSIPQAILLYNEHL